MTKLYPIGTQLITHRLSQASLISELFGEDDFSSYIPVPETYDESGKAAATFVMKWRPCFYPHADAWRVTVTAENQKWLSPVPIVGDLLEFKDPDSWLKSGDWNTYAIRRFFGKQIIDRFIIARPSMVEFLMREPKYRSEHPCLRKIIERTYPNGQSAPMIKWDEVIEPEIEKNKHKRLFR